MSDRSQHTSNGTLWKSIDELAAGGLQGNTGEFTEGTTTLGDSAVNRRGFMTLVSAGMALTAVACRRPEQSLIPATKSLQNNTPGLPRFYTSTYVQRNVAYGALVKTREGRPIKIGGNDQHPTNAGTTGVEMQGSLLSLYDPDRIRRSRVNKGYTTFDAAASAIATAITNAAAAGKRTVFLTQEHASPSFARLQTDIATAIPSASFVTLPAIINDGQALANRAIFGVDAELVPDMGLAKTIVCVEADPLGIDKLSTYHTRRFAAGRRPSKEQPEMSKLIVAEVGYSLTGMNADERVKLHPSQAEPFLAALERSLGGSVGAGVVGQASNDTVKTAEKAAAALKSAGSAGLVMAGAHLSPRAHAIATSINVALGSVGAGKPLDPSKQVPFSNAKRASVEALVADMSAGNVGVLVFCDVNPEYSADRAFRTAMAKVPTRVAINMLEDETAKTCSISIPASHWLESWGDAVSFDGTLSIQQPMILPLNEGIPSSADTLMTVARKAGGAFADVESYYAFVKNSWFNVTGSETGWSSAVQLGIANTFAPSAQPGVNLAAAASLESASVPTGMVVSVRADHNIGDGSYANNAWLQELPDPVTKVSWDNVALISPKTAVKLGLATATDAKSLLAANENMIVIKTATGSVSLPVWVQVGQADDVIVTQLGYGRTAGGQTLEGIGANAYPLSSYGSGAYVAATIEKTGDRARVATTQNHHTLDDGRGERTVAKHVTIGDVTSGHLHLGDHFYDAGKAADGKFDQPLSITTDYQYKGHRWGMVIDMSSCTGCGSCVVACQSENNIPSVGKEQVAIGRELHWIRLDRYYTGDMENPQAMVEPMLCQHCENAPCENVCPVAATTHSPEGLNEMTYNRCVGTRYCLNNCPYKVRRFNFLNYHKDEREPQNLVYNPEVTTRMRGIMEKCTFCVQRINDAKYHAKDAGRARVQDGEVVTACQEACPAGAIVFGDMNDPNSKVSKLRVSERGFKVLEELNVRPSVVYLAKVRNIDGSFITTNHHG
jgi:molybdopterin-containing oxidoreductase family iron-sulfur binding subunit